MGVFLTNMQHFSSQDIMDWSGMNYLWIIAMYLSDVWTLILTAPIFCRGSIDEQCNATLFQICSDEETS